MRADIAHAAGAAGFGGIGTPISLFIFDLCGQPALDIFDKDLADLANPAAFDNRPRFIDEWVAEIGVGQAVAETGEP